MPWGLRAGFSRDRLAAGGWQAGCGRSFGWWRDLRRGSAVRALGVRMVAGFVVGECCARACIAAAGVRVGGGGFAAGECLARACIAVAGVCVRGGGFVAGGCGRWRDSRRGSASRGRRARGRPGGRSGGRRAGEAAGVREKWRACVRCEQEKRLACGRSGGRT
jgi:hypothetical protein